jgi:tRNA-dihydrouridine synthase B
MLRIGPIELDFPVVQAALSGYSDGPMRRIARRCGAPYALHEVVLDRLVIEPGRKRARMFALAPDDHPVGGQLMGSEPERFAEAAALLGEAGFDVIDINFGCPVRKVLGRCRGGYLLSDPATALEILRQVRAAVPTAVPVTLKMRRGLDDSAESERNFFRIFDAALELGLAAVTVHGRTVRQGYTGPSDWGFLSRVKRHAGAHTVLGSGDLFEAQDIVRMLEATGVDGVSVARGCIGNPWIFAEARSLYNGWPLPEPPGVPEQGRVIRAHFDLSLEAHGAHLGPRLMRKFGIRYSALHPFAPQVKQAFVACRDASEWRAVLDEWYDPQRDWPPAVRRSGAMSLSEV